MSQERRLSEALGGQIARGTVHRSARPGHHDVVGKPVAHAPTGVATRNLNTSNSRPIVYAANGHIGPGNLQTYVDRQPFRSTDKNFFINKVYMDGTHRGEFKGALHIGQNPNPRYPKNEGHSVKSHLDIYGPPHKTKDGREIPTPHINMQGGDCYSADVKGCQGPTPMEFYLNSRECQDTGASSRRSSSASDRAPPVPRIQMGRPPTTSARQPSRSQSSRSSYSSSSSSSSARIGMGAAGLALEAAPAFLPAVDSYIQSLVQPKPFVRTQEHDGPSGRQWYNEIDWNAPLPGTPYDPENEQSF